MHITGNPLTGMKAGDHASSVTWWLIACAALIFAMVLLGGVTRLTGSGLSMVAWEPVSGVLPPLSASGWEAEFARYRESPEFVLVNAWMSVEDFKRIYWFEWAHRLLGRLIGLVFAVGLAWFVVRRRIDRALGIKLAVVFVLGAAQGVLGWYMVASGLVDDPHVSQYRLAAHLALAVVLYAYLVWLALTLGTHGPAMVQAPRRIGVAALSLAALVFVTMTSGAFVAGLKAGFIYNTFPMMGDTWLPAGLYALEPALANWFENPATAQLNHRILATVVLAGVIGLSIAGLRASMRGPARAWLLGCAAMGVVQYGLGVATLLLRVPTAIAAVHQVWALVLLTCLLGLAHASRAGRGDPPPEGCPCTSSR